MALITSGNFPKGLRPGLKDIFNISYGERKAYHADIYDQVDSDKQYEERLGMVGLGVGRQKPEGAPVAYSDMQQGYVRRTTNIMIALGMQVSHEAIKDNLYQQIFDKARELGFGMYQAKQIQAADLINNGYSSFTTADGVSLFNTAHVRKGGGTFSNRLAAGIDLTEASLEAIYTALMGNRNERGLLAPLMIKQLVVPPSLAHQAERLVKSSQQAETANNAINAIKSLGTVPSYTVNPFLTDSDAYFCTSDIGKGKGLIYQVREALEFDQDKDSDTFNNKFLAYERYAFDAVDPRCVFGSPGL